MMPDTTPANGTTDKAPEPPRITVAAKRAVDAYARMIALQHDLDDARTEYGRLVDLVPAVDQVAFYEAITDIRTAAHTARHAAEDAASDSAEVAHEDQA